MSFTVPVSRLALPGATKMLMSSFRSPGIGQALGAIGALGLFAITGFTCGGSTSSAGTSTLAPIMATGPAITSTTSSRRAATDKKCPAR